MLRRKTQRSRKHLSQIPAGSLIDIEIVMPASRKRVRTEFIGVLEDQYIILNYPNPKRLGAAADYVKTGTEIIVRALPEDSDGQIIAFKENIKAISNHPARLIFLYYPHEVQTYQLRAQTRVPALIPAILQLSDYNEVGVIKDISLSGMMFDIQKEHLPDDLESENCEVLIEGKDDNASAIKGKVCRIIESAEGNVSLGIQVVGPDTTIKAVLKDYLIDLSILSDEGES
ncbi:flagellar brake protein [Pseudoalteromonas rubra]|uniref:Flagellar brake protein n=1 Tax=Pseudoalteromonas rubra TaxID=43658 RepID=A0A5S3WHI2_9GAMM|nr:flagellar brake protein [Pseudoalteromonas rubra]TMP26626.1 flagellar brake protein [Pseudoalteromonas rubra]TMP35748.1 flagellar brake protein [Pseudoalteromonas rubra]